MKAPTFRAGWTDPALTPAFLEGGGRLSSPMAAGEFDPGGSSAPPCPPRVRLSIDLCATEVIDIAGDSDIEAAVEFVSCPQGCDR